MLRLMFIPLLVACSLPNFSAPKGGLAAKSANEQPEVATDNGVIQTLAPIGQTPPPTPKETPIPNSAPISAEQMTCRAKGGEWGKAGNLAAMTCYMPSKDAGKSCSKQRDCSSQCLARSKTCAPIWPMFGCNEVLQNDGSLVTLCIN